MCDRIFSKGKQTECEAFVKQYTDELISILKETDDPKLICILLGVCDKGIARDESWPAAETTVENCNDCVAGSRWALEQNQSGISLSNAFQNVCSSDAIPESRRKVCSDYVSHNGASIESVVRQTRNPNLICWKLELCRRDWIGAGEREVEEAQSLPSCFICKEIAKWVNGQVKQNRTEESIEAALSTVCKFLRNVENCQAKVDDWSSRLMIVLRQATQPELACELLGVCGFPKNEIESEDTVSQVGPGVTGSGTCYECQSITHFIQEELYSYDKEKRVEDFVIKNVCDKIPEDVGKETCESFVNQYGPSIMQLIAMKVFDAKLVCEQELRICPKTHLVPSPSNPSTDIEVTSQNTCNQCTASVRALDSLLSSEEIDRDISQLAAKACVHVPQQDQRQVRSRW